MTAPGLPRVFTAYVVVLASAAAAAVGVAIARGDGLFSDPIAFLALTALLVLVEATDLSYFEDKVRWGLSAAEAVLLPMLVVLSLSQVVVAAAVAVALARGRQWTKSPLKEAFNVGQYACAAAVAAGMWLWLSDGSGAFTVRNGAVAAGAVMLVAALTHLFVAIGLALAKVGSFVDAVRDVGPVAFLTLVGNIVFGLFFAASYTAAPWTVVLFPIPLAALYFGFRAVVRQRNERQRVERLHAASRALASSPDLGTALTHFLESVASMLSVSGARAVVTLGNKLLWSGVRGEEVLADMLPAGDDPMSTVLHRVNAADGSVIVGEDDTDELKEMLPARNLAAVPVRDGHGASGAIVVIDRVGADEFDPGDISLLEALANELSLALQARRLFDEAAAERERFQVVVEAVKDYAIYMLDPKGLVVSWNTGAARITGYKAAEIVGQHFSRFYTSDTPAESWERELTVAVSDGRVESEGWRVRKDGTRFLANEVVTPVWEENVLKGFAKISRDITERMEANKEREALQSQLHRAQKLETVGQLAGGIAHDFNNLLSIVLNCSSFLLEDMGPDQEGREDVEEIKQAATRAAALTRQLLVFSRRDMAHPEPLDLGEIVFGLEKLIRRAVGQNVAVEIDAAPGLGSVMGNAGEIEQILMNLAINARDAMSETGLLTVEASNLRIEEGKAKRYLELSAGDYVMLRVSDTGCGMSPDVMEKAFEPFFTTKDKGNGTGLGLATVYAIVKQCGGHIEIHSHEGLGTTFELLFPHAERAAIAVPKETVQVKPVGGNETVLLVEDEDGVRAVARRILEGAGYRVLEASDAAAALKAHEDAKPDLLVTDVVMPGMSGIELADRLLVADPRLRVVLMSGYSEALLGAAPPVEGAVVLQKPFTRAALLDSARAALQSSDISVEKKEAADTARGG